MLACHGQGLCPQGMRCRVEPERCGGERRWRLEKAEELSLTVEELAGVIREVGEAAREWGMTKRELKPILLNVTAARRHLLKLASRLRAAGTGTGK